MKKLIFIILLIVLLVSQVAYGEKPTTLEEAVRLANEEIASKYGEDPNYYDASLVNKEVWEKHGALVYGKPHGDKKGDDQRYIGYTPDGQPFGSPTFPRDDWAGGTFDERNWIEDPWDDVRTEAKGAANNRFNNTEEFSENMKAGLGMYYPEDTDGSRDDWHKYMQILQPPTQYSPGIAMMWHVRGGTIWYTTMILPSHQDSSTFLRMGGPNSDGEDPPPPERPPIEEPVLPPIPLAPPEVYETPRAPNLAVKWDTVPVKIGSSSSTTGKIERDSVATWNEYKYVVESWYPNETTGSIVRTNTVKTVAFANNMFLKGNKTWFTDSPKASYSVPSNAKPGTVLIVKMQLWKRVDESFPSMPPTPQKPKPEVPRPSYSRPTRPSKPSKPSKDASDSAWDSYNDALDSYYDRLDYYYEMIGPWNDYDAYIASPAYQEYLKRVADVEKLSTVRSSYNILTEGNPILISVSEYNFSEYQAYHTRFNSFVNSHLKRYVSVEGDVNRLYWFRSATVFGESRSKNVVIHSVVDPSKGGLNPGIIIKP